MNRILVAYFSATCVTAKTAEKLADAIGADIFAIEPDTAYTAEDLDWRDKNSRSSVEMNDLTFRPAVSRRRDNMEEYDTIFVGYPNWCGTMPMCVRTFLEHYDLAGKRIAPL